MKTVYLTENVQEMVNYKCPSHCPMCSVSNFLFTFAAFDKLVNIFDLIPTVCVCVWSVRLDLIPTVCVCVWSVRLDLIPTVCVCVWSVRLDFK